MSGWYLRISWRYELLIFAMSAPTSRSSVRYHSATFASVLRGRGGRAEPELLLDDDDELDEDDVQLLPPAAACSFIRRNCSSAAAFCFASRSSRSRCTR